MPRIISSTGIEMKPNASPIGDFSWTASARFEELAGSKYLHFELKALAPGKFSYPYHFHRNAEELFVILDGEATLRHPEGFTEVSRGDLVFFEEGPAGAHQLYNHGEVPCLYLDLRTHANVDVCEYPDSGKVNILPSLTVFEASARVPYYTGEEDVRAHWPAELLGAG